MEKAANEDEDRQAALDAVIGKLRADHPGKELRIAEHSTLPDFIVFRVPTRPEWRIFRGLQADPKTRTDASQMLVDTCVLWPEKDDLRKQLDAHPALVEVWAGEIVEAAGVDANVKQKKL